MKTNCWLMVGVLLATSAVAQDNTNAVSPATTAPPPAQAAPAMAPATGTAAPEAKPKAIKQRKHKAAARPAAPLSEPTVTLAPGPAQVSVKNLTARGQAGLKGEVVAHLKQGDTVTVLSQINLEKHKANEPAQWAQIAYPSSAHVWVFAKYIDKANNTVQSKKLNLRGGPGENYSILGSIERGTTVNIIRTKGEWMEIEPPTSAYAFVAAMYLTQTAPATPTTVAEQQPPAAAQPATPPVAQPPPPTDRIVSHEGVVGPVMSPVAPTKYMLYDPDTYQTIDYLYTTAPDLDLGRYVNMRIIVTGVEGIDQRWPSSPIVAIQSIQVVSTNAVKHVDLRSPRQRGNAH
ncbi:MAG TPA: SH3 domain-containing protein [Candidatus Limnocylindrales bacterium]|nr:SH3 domain-containing protein [Candidatus Limnocylindrales bacterium]